jgi:hypothetical protein
VYTENRRCIHTMAMSILVVTITLLLLYFIVCIQRRFSLVYTADDFHLCIQRRFSLVYTATIFNPHVMAMSILVVTITLLLLNLCSHTELGGDGVVGRRCRRRRGVVTHLPSVLSKKQESKRERQSTRERERGRDREGEREGR